MQNSSPALVDDGGGGRTPVMTSSANPGVVVHLDEASPEKHAAVFTNIENLMRELGEDTPVELVAHGPGLDALLADSPHSDRLDRLIAKGMVASACANTIRGRSLDKAVLAPGVTIVAAGVAQLVRRQREGWSYLRP